jgi:SAM-dependent methyltransferase
MMSARLADLPTPPLEMRQLVGPVDPTLFDNPSRGLVYPYLPPAAYERVFDFGCGCGRVARQLIQQIPRPQRYLGIDLHRGMIEWCRANLQPAADGFGFVHHDVFHPSFNPGAGKPATLPFPAEDRAFTLVEATSVFTHLTESQAEHYFAEVARILDPSGYFHATWFLFEKREYPMLTELQNALYTNEYDLSAAVIFDRGWLRQTAANVGLTIVDVVPPAIRNFHWRVIMQSARPGLGETEFPPDEAPPGAAPPPAMPMDAGRIGLLEDENEDEPPAVSFADRFPAPERPWTDEYVDQHRRLVSEVLDDDEFVHAVGRGEPLPSGYGVGFDERVVEFPWLFAEGLRGRVLDAGSSLNHEHILDRVVPHVAELHVVTLEPEPRSFPERRVSYVFADLRDLPYQSGYFDTVVCLSTLEHVGMDNALYGVSEPRAEHPERELRRAVSELVRVTAPSGRILVTVPYGRRENHGRLRQFDRRDLDALLTAFGGDHSFAVFSYGAEGWQVSDIDSTADKRYRDFLADPSPVPDRAAAARAVVCVSVAPQSARS